MKYPIVFGFLLGLMGCDKGPDNKPDYFFDFRPRQCDYLFMVPGLEVPNSYEGTNYSEFKTYPENGFDEAKYFFIALHTHNMNVDSIISSEGGQMPIFNLNFHEETISPIPDLETQIELNYRKMSASFASNLKSSSLENAHPVNMEYRVDGVENFKIFAMDKLFGQDAGTELNNYFKIIRYDPDFIASADTQNLLYGFKDKSKPEDIDEWLSLSPLAPALMYIAFKEVPDDLPQSIRFVVEMETRRGGIIRDTSQVIQFNN